MPTIFLNGKKRPDIPKSGSGRPSTAAIRNMQPGDYAEFDVPSNTELSMFRTAQISAAHYHGWKIVTRSIKSQNGEPDILKVWREK